MCAKTEEACTSFYLPEKTLRSMHVNAAQAAPVVLVLASLICLNRRTKFISKATATAFGDVLSPSHNPLRKQKAPIA